MKRHGRGFTLLELMVAVAISVILGALAYDAMTRTRPRTTFDGVSAEIQSLVHAARLQAMAEGVSVAVLVFPNYSSPTSQGRIIVYQDSSTPASSLFNPTNPDFTFATYDPALLAVSGNAQVVTTLDLPSGVSVGPSVGLTSGPVFPYSGVTTNVACSFCAGSGPQNRGAIVFDTRGRAQFYNNAGPISGISGGSFSICGTDLTTGPGTTATCGTVQAGGFTTSTLVIMSVSGTGRTFHGG